MGKKILLVEGPDDEHVIKAIFGQRNLPHIHGIVACGGVTELLEAFPVRLKQSDLEFLGIVLDADTNLAARWDSIKHRIASAGYQACPNIPVIDGTILEPPSDSLLPRVGIWLMPDNSTIGILENFLKYLVPAGNGQDIFLHAVNSVNSIPTHLLKFSELAKPKAILHTYLAWQQEPGRPLGQSITARFLDHDVPEVEIFVNWIKRLFNFD